MVTTYALGLIGTLLAACFAQEKEVTSTSERNEAWNSAKAPEEKAHLISAAMESSLERLPILYESVLQSIVRIETPDNENMTGVIVSAAGHILVGNGGGKVAKVHLSDGRIVNATAAGWSNEWRLSVMKINEAGPWPSIELGSTKDMKAGEPCLVIGYSPRGDKYFDSTPTARFGFIDRNQPARWFTTTCFPGFVESAAVVGMDGHLLGVDSNSIGFQSYHTAVDVFEANRDDLLAGKNLDWVRYPPSLKSMYQLGAGDNPEMLDWRTADSVLGTASLVEPMSEQELSDVKRIAMETTVRIVSKDRLDVLGRDGERWSGVIVSEDGYILTCGHTEQLPGERFTIYLSDGREAEALALGSNPISDIGLVKITTPGLWPFAEMVESSTLIPGEPLVVAGYPAINNITKKHWSTERIPQIDTSAVKHPSFLLWNGEFRTTGRTDWPYQGGMSGGGVFDRKGRYVGISQANDAPTCTELAKAQWVDLKQIKSVDIATGLPHPLRRRFVGLSKTIAQSVVEVMVDSKCVSIGTVVDSGGWILTKASVLNGKLSCRMPDQSVVVAEKRAESQEHDLALLKISKLGLTAATFFDEEPPTIAYALCGVGPNQTLKPGIVSMETREVPPEPSWKGAGTEDTQDGLMISSSIETNPITIGTKFEVGDIIVSVNGHLTPKLESLKQVLETSLSEYITGDLVSVTLRHKGVSIDVLTTFPPAIIPRPISGMLKLDFIPDELDTPRRSGFDAVFDTDIELLRSEVGCPVIDVKGRIRGISIVSRGRTDTQRGPTCVLPSDIVARVTKQLMAQAKSK